MLLSFNKNLLQVSMCNFFENWKVIDPLLDLDNIFDRILSFFTTNLLFGCLNKLFSDFCVNMSYNFLENRFWRYKTFDIFELLLCFANLVDFIIDSLELSIFYFIYHFSTKRFNKFTNQIT